MKVSPVVGTPTINNSSQSGNSPEKLARLKAIASGQAPIEEEDKDKSAPTGNRIVMNTNRTMQRDISPPDTNIPNDEHDKSDKSPESDIPDASVQATGVAEATQPLSPQFAELAKQRRALQVKEREFAEKEKALGGSTKAELEARIKSSPLSVLQEFGVTYDQLTNDILSAQGGINPDIQSLKAEIKALKEGVDKTFSDKDVANERAVLAEMRRNVNQLASQGDDFEMIRETQSESDVIDLIHRTYKKTGEILDESEAMTLVEEYLINESLKLARLKKVQGKLTPEVPLQPQPPTGMRTLTNKDSAKPTMDRRQRAIMAMQGNLKR